jgi:glutamine synthetase
VTERFAELGSEPRDCRHQRATFTRLKAEGGTFLSRLAKKAKPFEETMGALTVGDLSSQGFDTVILAATDLHGRLFGKRMTVHHFLDAGGEPTPVCTVAMTYDVTEGNQELELQLPFAGAHTGWNDFVLNADMATLRPYPGRPRTAICLADIANDNGDPLAVSPREILRGQVARARESGIEVLVGSELEFYLYRNQLSDARREGFRDLVPTTLVRADHRIGGQAEYEPFMARLRQAVENAGIPVLASQVEHGHGQWEVNLEYANALEMADRHVIYKESVKELALGEGLSVTFMARPAQSEPGSSCHLHCSLRSLDGEPLMPSKEGSREFGVMGVGFLAGLQEHLDETALMFAPYVNSYKRHAVAVAGAVNAWGRDNRTVAFRVLGQGDSLRIEHRYPGADTNPYLAMAGLIAAGMEGISAGRTLGTPVSGSAQTQKNLKRSPISLGAAIARFESSEFVRRAFGEEVRETLATYAKMEWEAYLGEVTEWEVLRGFELA